MWDTTESRYLKDGKIEKEDAEKVAKIVKDNHPVFKSITVVKGDGSWDYVYIVGWCAAGATPERLHQHYHRRKLYHSLVWEKKWKQKNL